MPSRNRTGPLPDEIFDWVHDTHALVSMTIPGQRFTFVAYRDPQLQQARRGGVRLDYRFIKTNERWIRARWLADPRRRHIMLPYRRARRGWFTITDTEWNGAQP